MGLHHQEPLKQPIIHRQFTLAPAHVKSVGHCLGGVKIRKLLSWTRSDGSLLRVGSLRCGSGCGAKVEGGNSPAKALGPWQLSLWHHMDGHVLKGAWEERSQVVAAPQLVWRFPRCSRTCPVRPSRDSSLCIQLRTDVPRNRSNQMWPP